MLKRTLQTPPENETITGYASELSRYLRSGVPGDRADEIVQEAHAHLLDRADEIAAQNTDLTAAEAEAQAVAAFTPAVAFAREMAQSAYETGHSKAWRTMGGVSVASLFTGVLTLLVLSAWFDGMIFVLPLAAIFCISVCAFQARRAQTRQFVLWGACATLFAFFYTGFFYLDGAPTDENWTQGTRTAITRAYNEWHGDTLLREKQLYLLQTGLQTFTIENPVVPDELKGPNGKGFLVPGTYLGHSSYQPSGPPQTVQTLAEARLRWRTNGSKLLAHVKQIQNSNHHYEEPLRVALQQTGFARTAWWYALVVVAPSAAYIVLFDWLFAKMGRIVYAERRKKRKIKPA